MPEQKHTVKKIKNTLTRSLAAGREQATCKVESIISVDESGQMVLPKDLGEKAGINAGDKPTVASREKNGEVCCITLL
jgi:hypothetical protein